MAIELSCFSVLLAIFTVCSATVLPSPGIWSREMFLDQERTFQLKWLTGNEDITIEMTGQTRGYVSVGFSHHGGMRGADIAVGWVEDDGRVHLEDRFAEDYVQPILDEHQDVELLGGWENGTHTTLRFRRKYRTCDPRDVDIEDDTAHVLYATHPNDPVNGSMPYHHEHRGTRSIVLTGDTFESNEYDKDVVRWEVRNVETDVPENKDTLYWCTIHKALPLARKHHVIGFKPLIAKESYRFVHHIVLYACNTDDGEREFEPLLNHTGFECYTRGSPDQLYKCANLLFIYTYGGEGLKTNEDTGFPLSDGDPNTQYFMLEIHYDNHKFVKAPKNDRSGVELFLTPKLRRYDEWTLTIGHEYANMIVSPRQKGFQTVGHCSAGCLQQTLPPEGVTVTHAQMHTHFAGVAVVARHFRNGVELPPIIGDKYYDFKFQPFRKLKKLVKLLPGDNLIVECIYNTTGRSNVTLGGLRATDEMCLVFLEYYPKLNLSLCISHPYMPDVAEFYGFELSNETVLLSERPPYENVVQSYDYTNKSDAVQELIAKGRFQNLCFKRSRNEEPDLKPYSYPEIKSTYVEERPECSTAAN